MQKWKNFSGQSPLSWQQTEKHENPGGTGVLTCVPRNFSKQLLMGLGPTRKA